MNTISRQAALSCSLCALLSCSVLGSVAQAQDVDPEWPCVQRLVPDVSPAVMWPLPVEEDMHSLWKQDAVIRPLAERLGDLPAYTEAEAAAVSNFAQSVPDEQKEAQLTLLAVGILDVTNSIRRHYISGIKRYTRQQIAIAEQIGATLNEISSLEGTSDGSPNSSSNSSSTGLPTGSPAGTAARSPDMRASDEPDPRREEVMATLTWHERVYDQREHAIRSLCEQPVELEETLSDVLRDLAQYLP